MSRSQVALLGNTVEEEHTIQTDLFVYTTSHSRNIFQMIAKNQVSREVSRPIPGGGGLRDLAERVSRPTLGGLRVWLRGSPGPHPGGEVEGPAWGSPDPHPGGG